MCPGWGCSRGSSARARRLPVPSLTYWPLSNFRQMEVDEAAPPLQLKDLDSITGVRAFFQGSLTSADGPDSTALWS